MYTNIFFDSRVNMTETKKKRPLNKLERRAQALRDNLKKRKQQQAKRHMVKLKTIDSDESEISLDNIDMAPAGDNQNEKKEILELETHLGKPDLKENDL